MKTLIFRLFLSFILTAAGISVFFVSPLVAAKDNIVLPKYTKPETEISLIAVGDIMLSRSVEAVMIKKKDFKFPFYSLSNFLNSADITFGNLETSIIAGRPILTNEFSFRTDPKSIQGLTLAGFDILSLANNHTPNFGRAGLEKTFSVLNDAKIKYVGAGLNNNQAGAPVILEKSGIKIGFLAYTYNSNIPKNYFAGPKEPGVNPANIEKMKKDMANLKNQVDFIVVSIHDGTEYQFIANKSQVNFAKAAIDAGANLIIGHHPHVVQNFEKYKDGYIFYSLGNFVFDQLWSLPTQQGLALKLKISKRKINSIEFFPIKINKSFQPEFAKTNDSQNVVTRLKNKDIIFDKYTWDGKKFIKTFGWLLIINKTSNTYQKIDIDNDGQAEEAVVVNKIGYIIKNNLVVWQTDPTWLVENVIAGDLNNDKILEIGFSLNKQGSFGPAKPFWVKENDKNISNHLFLYQWDKSTSSLKMIWGSSALDQPIIKMILGDFDCDNKNELAVLEKALSPKNNMTDLGLWRWNNFNFVNIFKSQVGKYSNLFVSDNNIYLK